MSADPVELVIPIDDDYGDNGEEAEAAKPLSDDDPRRPRIVQIVCGFYTIFIQDDNGNWYSWYVIFDLFFVS